MRRYQLAMFILWLVMGYSKTFAQQSLDIVEGPIALLDCDSSCIMLHANYPKPLQTSQYSINSTTYTPITITGTSISLNDDKFSTAIPLGFSFCFFGNVYTQCYVSDNGVLSFNPAYSGGACNTNTQQLLPYFNSTFPDNAIFFMFLDVSPALGGSIKYQTIGTAPYRKFVVDFQNMKIFGNTCSASTSSYQVVLYESTHIIEVFINSKVTCDNNAANVKNYSTVGIQNLGATQWYAAAGKHASIFTSSQEGIRIAPSGPIDYTMKWRNTFQNVIATNVDSIYFCPTSLPYNKIYAEITYNCPPNFLTDTVILDKPKPHIDSMHVVQPYCNGNNTGVITVYGSGVNLPLTYAINNGVFGSSNTFSNLAPGYYSVSIKDANNCRKDTSFLLNPIYNFQISLDSIHKPHCPLHDGEAFVHAINGTAPYTYSWSNGDTGPMADSLAPGNYQVIATDANGCTQILQVNVVNGNLPDATAILTKPLCGDSTGSIALTMISGTPPFQYQWNNGATSLSLFNIPAGVYNLVITDSNGCQKYLGYQLNDTLKILAFKDTTHTKCGLANGSAVVYANSGVSPYTYAWSPSGQVTQTANNLAAGTHICITTAANGCTRKDTFTVFASLPIINLISKANANCDSSNGKIYLNGVQNSNGSYTQMWSNSSTAAQITGLAPGSYWIKTTDSMGCMDIDTIQLLNDGKPNLGIVAYTEPLCYGDTNGSVTLTGIGGVAPYKYSLDGINFSSVAQISNISGGSYTIYLTDANSCLNDTVVNFPQPTQMQAFIQTDTVACADDVDAVININVVGGTSPFQYAINGGSSQSSSNFSNLGMGTYTVTVTDDHQCTKDFVVTVAGPPAPLELILDKQDIACFEDHTGYAHAAFKGGWLPYTYQWSNGATVPKLDSLGPMSLSISLTDARGCHIEKDASIEQLLCCKAVVPSAFSPNGDNLNERIHVMAISDVSSVKLLIYDRWGKQIFATRSLDDFWDGKFQGSECEIGVYFYYLEYMCPFKKEKVIQKGDITLVR